MVVYIEYVFLENTLFDFALLSLSFLLCKTKTAWWKILISACVGGVFAVVYPLILLPQVLLVILKIAVGLLLCFLPFPRIKNKKEWGRYALNAVVFFLVTFLYGGALTALLSAFFPQKTPVGWVVLGFAVLSVIACFAVQKLYQKRKVFQYIYPCKIAYNQQKISLLGYMDSGNLASKNGLPVCFLAPDVFYDLFGEAILFKKGQGEGQVCDEMAISTMAGERKIQLFRAKLTVQFSVHKSCEVEAYFAAATNMINREYQLLLNAKIIEG